MDAAQRFFAAAMRDYGVREGDHVRIPMRQCELARRRDVAASTVGAYLTAMGSSIVSRRPDIVIRVGSDEGPPVAVVREAVPPSTAELIAVVADLVAQQAHLLRAVAGAVARAEPRGSAKEIRADDVAPRGFVANDSDEVVEENQEKEEKDLPLPSPPRPREPRETQRRSRGSARIDSLLEPLHAAARERGLAPMSDRATIEAVLAEYNDETVRQLVDDVLCEVRNGRSVRSPFGLLVSRARRGVAVTTRRDEPSADLAPAPENPPASDDLPGLVVDDGLFDMLAQYEQNQTGGELVRALDEVIASELTATSLRLLSPTALRALRAQTFRRHGSPSTGTLARRDVAGARDASPEPSRIHPT